jgi:hypothetical protein
VADAPGPSEPFAWRFLVDEKPPAGTPLDPPRELLRVQWEELLKLCVPMHGDRPVKVDGFSLLRDPGTVIPVHPDDPRWEGWDDDRTG